MNESETIQKINIDLLIPNPNQPRKVFNDETLKDLSVSIKEYGILNPILARKKDDKYEIIAGERRFRAAKLAGLTEVPVIIKNIDDSKSTEIALIENLQRENISPIEEAITYDKILKATPITEQKLSEMIGKTQSFISNKLRLLKLPKEIQQALAQRKISERHARSLLAVSDEAKQIELLNRVINDKLTVKELDNIVNEKKITEEEIQTAIDDIMKSLKISDDEEKEEKESDKMDNGNFFPNMNQSNVQENQGVQAMPAPAAPVIEPAPMGDTPLFGGPAAPASAVPTIEPTPPAVEPAPIGDAPLFGGPAIPEPSMPTLEQPIVPPQPEPAAPAPTEDAPLFGGPAAPTPEIPSLELPPTAPMAETTPEPAVETPAPMGDMPLFGGPATPEVPSLELPTPTPVAEPTPEPIADTGSEPAYEIPVTSLPTPAPLNNSSDRLEQIKEVLNNNAIEYKLYNNETGHCIIIEL